jgi:hypothetical protein
VLDVKTLQAHPGMVGTIYQDKRPNILKPWETTFELVEYEPNSRLAFRYVSSNYSLPWHGTSYSFVPTQGGTRVSYAVNRSPGFVGLLSHTHLPLIKQDLHRLKQRLESAHT